MGQKDEQLFAALAVAAEQRMVEFKSRGLGTGTGTGTGTGYGTGFGAGIGTAMEIGDAHLPKKMLKNCDKTRCHNLIHNG